VNGSDLRFRDLKVFLTNRSDDIKTFEQLRALAQPFMQNGGSLYEVAELYTSKSIREMQKTFKEQKERNELLQNQSLQQKQQEIEQRQNIAEAQMQQAQQQHDQDMANANYQNDLDRINRIEIALIAAESKATLPDTDMNSVPDVLEISKLQNEQSKAATDYQTKMAEIASKRSETFEKLAIEREKLQVARENMANDLQVAKENAKGRAKAPAKKK
jgi:hypothetical protein